MNATLREARAEDLAAIMAIEAASFPCPWSEASFIHEFANDISVFKVLLVEGRVVGYYDLWACADEAHLLNVAVAKERRRRGYGSAMLADVVAEAEAAGCVRIFLEVRPGNAAAIHLYEAFGFRKIATRPRYYADREDADVMVKEFNR
jgi:ribosomal-protein-alanine N-acetyltransferase